MTIHSRRTFLRTSTGAAGFYLAGPTFFLPAKEGRQTVLINSDWRFMPGDYPGAEAPKYDDRVWQRVGLPHSFGIPYFGASRFYVGYGWYRRHLKVDQVSANHVITLNFDGVFQDAEIWVNGQSVGSHLGGYTGFELEVTRALVPGDNVIAIRVNNLWNARLNPRAGEHNFNGGIYRNVTLVTTSTLRVDWYGTFVTTPELSAAGGPVHILTDIRNSGSTPRSFTLETGIVDSSGTIVTTTRTQARAVPQAVATIEQQTPFVPRPDLWSPAHPNLYTAVSRIIEDGREIDSYRTAFGFRWFKWTPEQGFFLNGEHYYFHGANVHQDHAGWGDAVTDTGIRRDVKMVKQAGMDFIRGSHYPHSPVFSDACDREGVLLWEENSFWGTGGAKVEGFWTASAYPPNGADQVPFEENVERSLAEMIRIHRNHPSIVAWSMGNEVFFSEAALMPKVRTFLTKLVQKTHELDPTRPAVIGGVQRGEIDRIGDVAGYNGDGAKLFLDPGVPNAITEYGSTVAKRPGEYAPGYGDITDQPLFPWRSGQAIWCAFDHGSIFSMMSDMGMIDYFRLPKRQWYWYRSAYLGIAPPVWPTEGKAATLHLTVSHIGDLQADSTDDAQIIVHVEDANGKRLSNSPPVQLSILSGPGEFPTGRTIGFAPNSDIAIRDGEAAIELRSYQSGTIRLRATSPGLRPAELTIHASGGAAFIPGVTPLASNRPYTSASAQSQPRRLTDISINRPTDASSSEARHGSGLANDGETTTWWRPLQSDLRRAWWQVDFEGRCHMEKLRLVFSDERVYKYRVEARDNDGKWQVLLDHSYDTSAFSERTEEFPDGAESRLLRITFLPSENNTVPRLAEVQVIGEPIE
jgi:beta-galactosidase